METLKVLPRPLPLVCRVVVSLFCLIDSSQGASSEFGREVKEIEDKQPGSRPTVHVPGKKGIEHFTKSVSIVPSSNITLSDRIGDLEYSEENETRVETQNKTVSLDDKVDPAIQEEDNFCPVRFFVIQFCPRDWLIWKMFFP
ncbi:unnamed protein product [Allacma fusca]|uniref:Uncharacterized protein n=1 Tax=Allacma fusca TaxID=39272 RepID=A0A8J2NYD7_9HEXA|nr:unnamed protein product [Allacma fusca]